jgi:hypothetical protein
MAPENQAELTLSNGNLRYVRIHQQSICEIVINSDLIGLYIGTPRVRQRDLTPVE